VNAYIANTACIAAALAFLTASGVALAQEPSRTPLATDRPGFLFSSLTVGRGVVQAELGLPAVTLYDGTDTRTTSLVGLLRVGVGDDFELRLGSLFFNEVRVEAGGRSVSDRGYGDLEAGLKWHLLDNEGARPSFALIPSVIVPTGEDGVSVEDPVYQFNTATEWNLADGWAVGLLAGFLHGAGEGHYLQQTYGALLGRTVGSWSPYVEAVHVHTDLDGASDTSFLGGGVKYLVSNDVQVDVNFDRGVTDESPDWLLGLGLSVRF
jgi:hypothetical protein